MSSAFFRSLVHGSNAWLQVEGDLDLDSRLELAAHLARIPSGCRALYLDLGRVQFVDCGSLSLIDDAGRRLESSGSGLVLVSASPCFERVAEMAGYRRLRVLQRGRS